MFLVRHRRSPKAVSGSLDSGTDWAQSLKELIISREIDPALDKHSRAACYMGRQSQTEQWRANSLRRAFDSLIPSYLPIKYLLQNATLSAAATSLLPIQGLSPRNSGYGVMGFRPVILL